MKFRKITHDDEKKIIEDLHKNNFNDCEFGEPESINDITSIEVTGDWKHHHGRLDNLMKTFGYISVGELIYGDDSSDWYSSKHYYMKNGNPRVKFSISIFEKMLEKKYKKIEEDINAGRFKLTLVNPEDAQ